MRRVERVRVFHPSGGPMLTKQSERDSTDVNLIMDSWIHAGAAVAGHMNPSQGTYGDFSSGIDYHGALDAVKDAERCFMALKPEIRSHVDNDPGKFLDMVFDPERREELERLGIVDLPVSRGPGGDVGGDVDGGLKPKAAPPAKASPPESTRPDEPGDAGGGAPVSKDPAAGLFD